MRLARKNLTFKKAVFVGLQDGLGLILQVYTQNACRRGGSCLCQVINIFGNDYDNGS